MPDALGPRHQFCVARAPPAVVAQSRRTYPLQYGGGISAGVRRGRGPERDFQNPLFSVCATSGQR